MRKSLEELHQEFVDECRYTVGLAHETVRSYENSFNLLMRTVPTLTLEMISPKMMTEFFKRLQTRERSIGKYRKMTGIKNSTVATYRSKLNSFFKWLAKKNLIDKNPFDEIPYPSVSYDDRKFMSQEDVEKIMTSVVMHDWKSSFLRNRNLAIFAVLLYTGIRRGELLGLRLIDVDLKRKTIFIRPETSKSKKGRTIPINSRLFVVLEDYMQQRKAKGFTDTSLFISEKTGNPLTIHGLKHLVKRVCDLSGVKFHLHLFRHTFAVNMLNNGCDIAKLQQLMGHKDIRMTEAYLRCLPTKAMRGDIESLDMHTLV